MNHNKHLIRTHVEEFKIPPFKDMLVLGRSTPIGCIAIRWALDLPINSPFEQKEIEDDIIGDFIVQRALLRRIPIECLIEFTVTNIKPLLEADESLQISLDVQLVLESADS